MSDKNRGEYQLTIEEKETRKSGFYVSKTAIVIAVLAVLALCVGVGLLCYCIPDRSCKKGSGTNLTAVTYQVPTGESVTPVPFWGGRVQSSLQPEHYSVHLKVYLDEDDGDKRFTFDGKSYAEFSFTEPTNVVKIHVNKLDIDEDTVILSKKVGGNQEKVEIANLTMQDEYQFYVVECKTDMEVGVTYRLAMDFVGYLEDDLVGFYRSSYKTNTGETRWLATTQFQSTDARKAFPCFDEPALKATFDIVLEHRTDQGRHALSNMPIKGEEKSTVNGKDWKKVTYDRTVKMSTYLLAFVVSDLVCYREQACKNDSCQISVCARDEMKHTVSYALNITKKVINYYEEYFGIEYPLPKQDQAAVPDFAAGAMENWGLILYRETYFLFDPQVSSAKNKQKVAIATAHELAHQWFGNLMSPAWWDDLWLNEGFASYLMYIGDHHAEPDWRMLEQFVNDEVHEVFELDGLGSSHPVLVDVGKPDEITEIFDTISYSKGAAIIRMMNYILGEDTFREGLTLFLTEQSYKAATSDDLWDALQRADTNGKSTKVKAVMDTWTLQMGYPVVSIKRTGSNTAKAEQKHFLINPDAKVEDKYGDLGYKWYVPLNFITQNSPNWDDRQDVMMDPTIKNGSVDLDLTGVTNDDWILANVNQFGYYRVNYENENWIKLMNQLNDDHLVIPVISRSGLIDDAFNLARSGDMDQVTALDLTKYMIMEKDYLPWDSFINVIIYIRDMLSRTGAYGDLEEYMVTQTQRLYEELTWDDSGEDHVEHFHRENILATACRHGNQMCIDEAKRQFKQWMDNPSQNNISPNLKSVVYCNAILHGGVVEWDFMWSRYQQESDYGEKSRLQTGMACSNEPWILSRYLEYAMDGDKIKKQDASRTIQDVAKNYVGRSLAWDFFRARYDDLFDMYGSSAFTWRKILKAVTKQLNTEFQLEQLTEFGAKHPNFGSAARAYQQVVEGTKTNIKWMKNNFDNVQNWLKTQ
ncbi:aminopeptidase N-like [Glandiceps talaboti]